MRINKEPTPTHEPMVQEGIHDSGSNQGPPLRISKRLEVRRDNDLRQMCKYKDWLGENNT